MRLVTSIVSEVAQKRGARTASLRGHAEVDRVQDRLQVAHRDRACRRARRRTKNGRVAR